MLSLIHFLSPPWPCPLKSLREYCSSNLSNSSKTVIESAATIVDSLINCFLRNPLLMSETFLAIGCFFNGIIIGNIPLLAVLSRYSSWFLLKSYLQAAEKVLPIIRMSFLQKQESRVSCENRNPVPFYSFLPSQERRLDSRWSLPLRKQGREWQSNGIFQHPAKLLWFQTSAKHEKNYGQRGRRQLL